MEDKFILNIGCHRGTITSRDNSTEYFDTYDEAYQAYRNFYHSIGYQVWFADIIAPDGTKERMESNPYI